MKKRLKALVILAIISLLFLNSCGAKEKTKTISIAAPNGPTGEIIKGFDSERYNTMIYEAPSDIASKFISGEVDIAFLPSNMAALLYAKTKGDTVAISTLMVGGLKIISNGESIKNISDLNGKNIYASGKGGTPEYVLREALEGVDVNISWLSAHSECAAKLLTEENAIALIPEPLATKLLSENDGKLNLSFDLNEIWFEKTGSYLPLAVVVTSRSFLEDNRDLIDRFVGDLKKDNSDVLVSIDALKSLNEIMYEIDPKSIGGNLPGEDLYFN